MAVINAEVAAFARRRGAHVPRACLGDVTASMAEQPHAESEINVLRIAKEIFIEPAHLREHLAPVQRRRRAGRKYLAGRIITIRNRAPMSATLVLAGNMINIARAIEH